MKSLILFLLSIPILADFLLPWQQAGFVATELATKSLDIPQFILDTRHPWLETKMGYLEGLEDPRGALCNMNSNLRPTDQLNDSMYPTDLFKYLEIDNERRDVYRHGWKNAIERLEEMLDCPAALHDVGEFKVDISIAGGKYNIMGDYVFQDPPPELPGLFVKALSSMPRLQKLSWNTFENGKEVFEKAFTLANLTLPSVCHVVPAMLSEFVVKMCSNVKHIESRGGYRLSANLEYSTISGEDDIYMRFVGSASPAKSLTSFTMTGEWEVRHVEMLSNTNPTLTTINIGGTLQDEGNYRNYRPYEGVIQEYTDALASFQHLENLYLPHPMERDICCDNSNMCWLTILDVDLDILGRTVNQQRMETTENTGRIVLAGLPNLKHLRIGDHDAKIKRDEFDKVDIVWSWTGRMKEVLHEKFPGLDERHVRYEEARMSFHRLWGGLRWRTS